MNQEYQDEKSRRAFIKALQLAGLLNDNSAGSVHTRPYKYHDATGKLLVQGYFYPYPRYGLSLVGLVIVEPFRDSNSMKMQGFRQIFYEFKDWELSPNPVPDAFVWFLGECICVGLNLLRSACVTAKQRLAITP
ncbi:MAG: hypothetical protein HGB34_03125 [Candidatus Moranbacteria bacterium]|nr:hypothetical protein [Candidatus Moranbacteria bacterium]NTW75869.1 hypothetical protein [Candidatus Moranbacteria bacterium]